MTSNIETMRPVIAGAVGNPASTCQTACEGNAYQLEARHLKGEVRRLAARVAELEAQIKAAREQRPIAYLHRGSGNDIVEVKIGASLAPVEYRNISPYVTDLPLGRSAPLFTSPIPAEPVNARLLDLLREAEKCISAAVRIEQHAHDEPPYPVSEWDYEAYRLAGDICAAIVAAEAQGVTKPKRLTDEEIMQAVRHISFNEMTAFNIARAIEAAVLGAQAPKNGD